MRFRRCGEAVEHGRSLLRAARPDVHLDELGARDEARRVQPELLEALGARLEVVRRVVEAAEPKREDAERVEAPDPEDRNAGAVRERSDLVRVGPALGLGAAAGRHGGQRQQGLHTRQQQLELAREPERL